MACLEMRRREKEINIELLQPDIPTLLKGELSIDVTADLNKAFLTTREF